MTEARELAWLELSPDERFEKEFIRVGEEKGYFIECNSAILGGEMKWQALVMPKEEYDTLLAQQNKAASEQYDRERRFNVYGKPFEPLTFLPWWVIIEQKGYAYGMPDRRRALLGALSELKRRV